MRKIPFTMGNPEFAIAAQSFNLAAERGEDPERVAREKREAEQRAREAAEYQSRMQRALKLCPGLTGCDPPAGPGLPGRVVIDPRQAPEARAWLKARFRVNEEVRFESADGLAVEIISRAQPKPGQKRVSVTFDKPVQYTLDL